MHCYSLRVLGKGKLLLMLAHALLQFEGSWEGKIVIDASTCTATVWRFLGWASLSSCTVAI